MDNKKIRIAIDINKQKMKITGIFFRYLLIVLSSLGNLYVFYLVLTPLTLYPIYFLFSIFFESSLLGNTITLGQTSVSIAGACVAGAAYFLLLALNLATPEIKLNKRTKMLIFSFGILLILNILRVFIFGILLSYNFSYFDILHKISWYFLSTFIVAGIWFLSVNKFKINKIPFYSDIKSLYALRQR